MASRATCLLLVAAAWMLGSCGDGDVALAPAPERCSACQERPTAWPRAPRLTHAQWENATRDLLQLDAPSGLASSFIPDPYVGSGHDGTVLSVSPELWEDYRRASEILAERVTSDTRALARLTPAGADDPLVAFVDRLGGRAYRRPLIDTERAALVGLARTAALTYPETDSFLAGARVVIEALLQSPHFLYRLESSSDAPSSYDVASRLSFALWNTMPDDELFAEAAADSLRSPERIRAQAERMLASERARAMVSDFHGNWVDVHGFGDVVRSTTLFPEYRATLPTEMQEETRRFVDAVVFDDSGGLRDLLTASFTIANADLAAVYGGVAGADWQRTELGAHRAGLFTQVGWLASHATSVESDPIRRGADFLRRVMCVEPPVRPDGAPALPPVDASSARTMREQIEAFTGVGTCGESCHATLLNPIGFAFEHYDALGRWRDLDRGLAVDASASFHFETGTREYDGAVALMQIVAAEPATHRCYARRWVEYLYERPSGAGDAVLVDRIARASLEGTPIRVLIVDMLASPEFLAPSDPGVAP